MFLGAFRPLAVFCGGSLCAFLLCLFLTVPAFLSAGIAFFFFLLCFFHAKRPKLWKTLSLLFLGLTFGCIWSGLFNLVTMKPARLLENQVQSIRMTVTEVSDYGLIGFAQIDSHRTKLYLSYYTESRIQPGDCISAEVRFSLPSYQGGFDGEQYYYSDGIFLLAKSIDKDQVSVIKAYSPFYTVLGRFRQWADHKADRIFGYDASSIKALLLGRQDSLSDEQKDMLSTTGLSHTFVVSGMHLSFLTGILRFAAILHPLMWIPVLLIVLLYAVLTGFGLSVVRAFLMLLYQKIGDLLELQPDPLTSLLFTLLLILLPNPYALLNAGLVLSYLAVAGILFLKPWFTDMFYYPLLLNSPYQTLTKCMKSLLSSVTTSLSAGIAILPAVVYYIGEISFIFLPANLLLLLPVTFCFYAGLFALFVSFISPSLGSLLAYPAKWSLSLFWDADHILFTFPQSGYGLYQKPFLICVCLAIIFLFILAVWKRRLFHPLSIGFLICSFLLTNIYVSLPKNQYDFTVTCLSSKQPCMILSVGNQWILFGYDSLVDSFLRKRNIDTVDFFIPLSYDDTFPSSTQYKKKIQEPCSLLLEDITVSYTYQGNIIITYQDYVFQILSSPGSCIDNSLLTFVTSDILKDHDMNQFLNKYNIILLGKPSQSFPDNISLQEIPYHTGDLLITFSDGTYHFE